MEEFDFLFVCFLFYVLISVRAGLSWYKVNLTKTKSKKSVFLIKSDLALMEQKILVF